MSQAGAINSSTSPPVSGIQTIDGDTGFVTGNEVTIYTNNLRINPGTNSGSSVKFVGNNLTTMILRVTDASSNTIIGEDAGNLTLSSSQNTIVGASAGSSMTSGSGGNSLFGYTSGDAMTDGQDNCGYGANSLGALTTGDDNCAFGDASLPLITTGSSNIAIGSGAGSALNGVLQSNNILIGNIGISSESNATRIGTQGTQTKCFVAGITGITITPANQQLVTIDSSSGQLGITTSTGPIPNQVLTIVDDFVTADSTLLGVYNWQSTGASFITGNITNPGIVRIPASQASAYVYLGGNITFGSDTGVYVLGGGEYSQNFVVRLVSLSDVTDTYTMYIGLWDVTSFGVSSTAPPTNGIYFQYTDTINSGNWQIVAISSGVATTTNTSVPANTNFNNFGFVVNAAASSVSYTINGVSVGTITTNIPTTEISPMLFSENTNGTPSGFDVDLFYSTLTLNNAR